MDFNRLVFPAPRPTYNDKMEGLVYIQSQSHETDEITREIQIENELKIKVTILKSTKNQQCQNHKIPCVLYKESCLENGVIIYFHGNAEDIGMSYGIARILTMELQLALLAVEYPGYGIYEGNCNSDQMIKDAYSIMEYITKVVPENKIIVIGRSIGSGLAVEVASKYSNLRTLVLISAFTSLQSVVKEIAGEWISKLVKERFRNLEKMHRVKCPTLLIHGSEDTLIPKSHSEQLMQQCGGITQLKIQEGMTHNIFQVQINLAFPLKTFLIKIAK